ncbi:ArdC-like ssDNA-binding domain-containing protein [Nitrosospira multiformis]|uniref:ArdC-like ssDNA-binding domain-containing protein n=1 Tax=Nitrosospira TaxID=35798 RepID=UPI000942C991
MLWAEAMMRRYSSDRWLTCKQATNMGGQVRARAKKACSAFFSRHLNASRGMTATTLKKRSPYA